MKRLITFFIGILLLGAMFCALFITGSIYDTEQKQNVATYFFQPNAMADQRPGVPVPLDQISETKLLDMLIAQYVKEYLYILPYTENIDSRTGSGRSGAPLAAMSSAAVFNAWKKNVAPEIKSMAEAGVMRTVSFVGAYRPENSEYYTVVYKTTTWPRPNDFNTPPVTTRGELLLGLDFEPGIRPKVIKQGIDKVAQQTKNLATMFRFIVNYVEMK